MLPIVFPLKIFFFTVLFPPDPCHTLRIGIHLCRTVSVHFYLVHHFHVTKTLLFQIQTSLFITQSHHTLFKITMSATVLRPSNFLSWTPVTDPSTRSFVYFSRLVQDPCQMC